MKIILLSILLTYSLHSYADTITCYTAQGSYRNNNIKVTQVSSGGNVTYKADGRIMVDSLTHCHLEIAQE